MSPLPVDLAAEVAAVLLALVAGAALVLALRARARARQEAAACQAQGRLLDQARETHQALWDNSDAAILSLDRQGRYQAANPAGLALLGAEQEVIHGKYVEEHLDAPSAARLREVLDQALAGNEVRLGREPLTLAGRERFVDLYCRALHGDAAGGGRLLVILRDQTDQKLMDQHLWQTEKLASLGLLAAGVAHQINNPLGVLMGFSQLALQKAPADAPFRRELTIIRDQGQQCKEIVDGLLNFTRLSELGSGPGDLLAGLMMVSDTVSGVLQSQGISLERDLAADLPPGPPGCGAVQQVLLNLMNNAKDAMPDGGLLKLSARLVTKPPRQGDGHGTLPATPRYIEIILEDDGTGIAPEVMPRIFDPFFTTKPEGKGTGLGLSVAYGIVRELGGTLTCDSPPPGAAQGRGTRFTIRLPAGREEKK